jgi:hypothetical protein
MPESGHRRVAPELARLDEVSSTKSTVMVVQPCHETKRNQSEVVGYAGGVMATEYTVGLRLQTRAKVFTIEAEDALVAALKAKHAYPEAIVTYVRRSNRRGDRRHPHGGLSEKVKK